MATHEQYERALQRAHDEGIVIVGDSIAPDGRRAWSVYNPKYGPDSWYTVRQERGTTQLTCNCPARVPICKHVAKVMEDERLPQPPTPERHLTADQMRAERNGMAFLTTDTRQFSMWR